MPTLPYTGDGSEYDVVVGGVPFRLATSSEVPQGIETIAVSKEQIDTERDPGEQSLAGFWRRSQASFAGGAGYLYDNSSSEGLGFDGFFDSSGVDVFTTPGRVKPLRMMADWTIPTTMTKIVSRRGEVFAIGTNGSLYRSVTAATLSLLLASPSGSFQDCTYASDIFAATSTNRLYKISLAGVSAGYWLLSASAGVTSPVYRLGWGKYRLWAYNQADIFQPSVSAAPDNGATPITPFFTNPTPGWTYTCFADGPAAAYFGGHDGEYSAIQMVTLNTDGSLPTLSGAITATILPQGELIRSIEVLAGQYIGIGTSVGFRVGRIESSGAITYGPLLIDHLAGTVDGNLFSFYGVNDVTSHGDSFYVACRNDTYPEMGGRVYRVDTSNPKDDLIFPFANDVVMPTSLGLTSTNYIKSLDTYFQDLGGGQIAPRLAVVLSTGAVCVQDSGAFGGFYETSSWIQLSRIRFGTTEPKAFKYATLGFESAGASDSVELESWNPATSTWDSTHTWSGGVFDTAATLPSSPLPWLGVRLNITSGIGAPPSLTGLLVRALPASQPQRLITLPLLCFDSETTRSGQTYTTKGWARQRLEALQAFEDTASTLTYSRGDTAGTQSVVVDSMRFVQTSPPSPTNQEGAGGILVLQLRTVDA